MKIIFDTLLNPWMIWTLLLLSIWYLVYAHLSASSRMLAGGGLFTSLYFVYFLTLVLAIPEFVTTVWNLNELSRRFVFDIPIEELMFAFSFELMWESIYEHFNWQKIGMDRKIYRPTAQMLNL